MTKQDIKRIKLKVRCIDCDGYWTETQLENNSHKCKQDIKEKTFKTIDCTKCNNGADVEGLGIKHYHYPDSNCICECHKPTSLPSQQIEKRLMLYLWGKRITRDSKKDAKMLMPFVKQQQNDLIKRVLESFDIELEAWMKVHYKQNRSFSTESLVKHMKVFLEKLL